MSFLGLVLVALSQADEGNLRPEEVLVVANKASAASVEVARHYLDRRRIPPENYVELDFPGYVHPHGISYEKFETKAVAPIKKHLEERGLKDKVLCIVTTYDVPYVVSGATLSPEEFEARAKELPENRRGMAKMILTTRASFDSELAWLYRTDAYGAPLDDLQRRLLYCYSSPNPYHARSSRFRSFRGEAPPEHGRVYLTARLDGPTPQVAKGLVDLALQAEREGPSGIGYFDAKGRTLGKRKIGYGTGEFWVRRSWIDTHNAGLRTVREETPELFAEGACPDALLYWGWYALTNYRPSFTPRFRPGAIAVHTASGEAVDLRRNAGSGVPWCAGFLAHGAAVCTGPVGEPFLNAFPSAEVFFPRLYQGWSVGEAYWNALEHVSWMMVLIGDPLYAPFAGSRRPPTYVEGRMRFLNPEAAEPALFAVSNAKVGLVVELQGYGPVFKDPSKYALADPGINAPAAKLVDLDRAVFEVKDGGTRLVVTGASIQTGAFAARQDRGENGDELELYVDLGPDGGRKIVSQLFTGRPPAGK